MGNKYYNFRYKQRPIQVRPIEKPEIIKTSRGVKVPAGMDGDIDFELREGETKDNWVHSLQQLLDRVEPTDKKAKEMLNRVLAQHGYELK